nr:hypothetical protein [Tanacetum cinerariifolium]
MTSLADKAILLGTDNRPPMLEKDMYDSWKSRMELYMLNRQHGWMILEYVENGPLLWPTIEEDGVTRLKKYSELSATEAIQADCDVKAKNIILQGLPLEVYALVITHKVAKELWEQIQMLMQGTSLTNKFVTDVKLVRDLHTTNVDQLHAYFGQHEYHANEVRLMHERTLDPLALVSHHQMNKSTYQQHQQSYHQHQFQPQASAYQSSPYVITYPPPQYASQAPSSTHLLITYPPNDIQSSVNHNVYNASSSIPLMEYAPTIHQQTEFSPPDTGLVVLVFQKAVVTSRVTIQPIQGRQNSMTAGSSRPYTSRSSGTSGKHRVIVCYKCKGKGHMSKQCTKPKRKRDAEWFKDKVLLVQAQANGQVLQEEDLPALQDDLILSVIEQLKTQVVNCTKINQDNKHVNEILTAELERYKNQERILKEQNSNDKASVSCAQSLEIKTLKHTLSEHLKENESLEQKLKRAQQLKPKLYDGSVIEKSDAIVTHDSEETLLLAEESRSKMLKKQNDPKMPEKKVITKPVDYAVLNQLSKDFETRFVPQTRLSAEQ